MSDTVVYGNGHMAVLARFYLSRDTDANVVAFTVDRAHLHEEILEGLPVLPFDEITSRFPVERTRMFVAMGFGRVNRDREERYREVKAMGYQLISYVSSSTILGSNVQIGENCFVMEGNIIQPFARIGNDVTLGPGNCIGHHCIIEDHCFFASRADLSGHVTVGSYSFIGANASVRNSVIIGRECVIGAGTVILKDTRDREVYRSPSAELLPLPSDKLPRI
jgi:sugar O-acyltransferase (sialic acid O-acetyltransferase NeuD family)